MPFLAEDPWMDTIKTYLADNALTRISTTDLLSKALDADPAHQTQAMTKHLRQVMDLLGWTYKKTIRFDDGTRAGYTDPNAIAKD